MTAANEVYEIVHERVGYRKRWLRPDIEGAIVLSIRRIGNDEQLFRHIEEADHHEDDGDDHGHLQHVIAEHLATMTVAEFEKRWL